MEFNIKPNNPEEIVKKYNNKMKMLWGDPVFDFKIKDGNILITNYHDNKDRKEVKIPEFVYGFSTREEILDCVGAFYRCKYIEKIIGTSKLYGSMQVLFYDFEGKTLKLENFDTEYVTNMIGMFSYCGWANMIKLELGEKFNTSNVIDMRYMFDKCGDEKLTEIKLGNNFNTSNVNDMSYMFRNFGEKSLNKLNLGEKFDTSNVKDMRGMFCACGYDKMSEINIGNKFNTENVINMDSMFSMCGYERLVEIDLGYKFSTKNVKSMKEMFYMISDRDIYRNGYKIDVDNFIINKSVQR